MQGFNQSVPLVAKLAHRRGNDFPALVVRRRFAFLQVREHFNRNRAPESPTVSEKIQRFPFFRLNSSNKLGEITQLRLGPQPNSKQLPTESDVLFLGLRTSSGGTIGLETYPSHVRWE